MIKERSDVNDCELTVGSTRGQNCEGLERLAFVMPRGFSAPPRELIDSDGWLDHDQEDHGMQGNGDALTT